VMKTRTGVHSAAAQRRQRVRSEASAVRAGAAVQLSAQILLWITFFAYDRAAQAVWQAALLWGIPLAALYLLWKKGAPALHQKPGRYALIALLPCLMLDAAFVLYAFSGMIGQLIPQYPGWVGVAVPSAFALGTAYLARPRGVSYGTDVFKWLLLALFVCGTVFLRASTRADRLWPLMGKGFSATALAALGGAGSLWGASLLFALPKEGGKTAGWTLVPWVVGLIWALWYGFVRPWETGDVMAVAEKMMGFARHASSITLYEMAGVMWMLLLPLALTGALSAGERLLLAAFEKCPRVLAHGLVLAPGLAALLIAPESVVGLLGCALPWRIVLSAGAGAFLCILERRRKA